INYVLVRGVGVVVTGRALEAQNSPAAENGVSEQQPMPDNARLKPQPVPLPQVSVNPTPAGPILDSYGHVQQGFVQVPPVYTTAPPPYFPTVPTIPPAGSPNGPGQNTLFGRLPIYQEPALPIPGSQPIP